MKASPGSGQGNESIDRLLDVRGHDCPVPALQTRQYLDRMQPGQVLEVQVTDPLAPVDLQVLCDRLGHDLIKSQERCGVWSVRIRVSSGRRADAG